MASRPPVAYSSAEAGKIIINPDLGGLAPWAEQLVSGQTALIYAWCERDRKRVDVIEWLSPLEVYDRVLAKDFTAQDDAGRPFFVAPLVLVSDELGMEYPDKASALADSLDGFGVSRNQLLRGLTSASTINRHIGSLAGITKEPPVVVLLGTPARRVTGNNRLAHITAWHFDDLGERILNLLGEIQHYENDLTDEVRSIAEDWLGIADINWMVAYENRPEVTNRRDSGSAASWLIGKRVLVLGCGALGAPIAEQCVRAGVSSLTVADNGSVNPGILVRQPYTDADVGFNKARRLAKRLSTIRRDLVVQPVSSNVISMFIGDDGAPPDFDLVIDATADVSVRAAVEAARTRRRDEWPPLITGLFGHDAVRAIATLSRPGATGGAHDILRRLAIEARGAAANNWSDIAEDFFPDPPRRNIDCREWRRAHTATASSGRTTPSSAASPASTRSGSRPELWRKCEQRCAAAPECVDQRSKQAGCFLGHLMRQHDASMSTQPRVLLLTAPCQRCTSAMGRPVPKKWWTIIEPVQRTASASSVCGTRTRMAQHRPARPMKLAWDGSSRPTALAAVLSWRSSVARRRSGRHGTTPAWFRIPTSE
jgi:hypothetical protein